MTENAILLVEDNADDALLTLRALKNLIRDTAHTRRLPVVVLGPPS